MNYAKILKEIRAERGLTQVELAKLANLAPSCIAMIEVGKNEPTAKTLICLSQALNVSVDYLLGREDDFGIVKSGAELQLKEDEAKLLSEYRLLDEINKIKAQTFIYALAH